MRLIAHARPVPLLAILLLPASGYAQHQHSGPTIGLDLVAEGLTAPMELTAPEDDTGRRFAVDQIGVVRILARDGRLLDEPFLDLGE